MHNKNIKIKIIFVVKEYSSPGKLNKIAGKKAGKLNFGIHLFISNLPGL